MVVVKPVVKPVNFLNNLILLLTEHMDRLVAALVLVVILALVVLMELLMVVVMLMLAGLLPAASFILRRSCLIAPFLPRYGLSLCEPGWKHFLFVRARAVYGRVHMKHQSKVNFIFLR